MYITVKIKKNPSFSPVTNQVYPVVQLSNRPSDPLHMSSDQNPGTANMIVHSQNSYSKSAK